MADSKDTKDQISARIAAIKRQSDEAAARSAEHMAATDKPEQLFLPGLDEFLRAMPNHIARSSLFAPVAPGRKRMHEDSLLVSRADAVIKFWGKQLDESQADVWLQAMFEAMRVPLGQPVKVNRSAFLTAIGRNVSGPNYKWLHRSMVALSFAMLIIEITPAGRKSPSFTVGKTKAIHLISGFDYDDEAESYTLHIDPRWRVMYRNREFALIDWEKRLRFGPHQNMAKALQRLAATSADKVQRYSLEWLKQKMEYTGRQRDFEAALKSAMVELERLEIITAWKIEHSTKGKMQAVWTML
jgi:hypothetical protein